MKSEPFNPVQLQDIVIVLIQELLYVFLRLKSYIHLGGQNHGRNT